MGIITKPYTFASGRVVDGTQINANFDALYTAVGGAVLTTDPRLSDARPLAGGFINAYSGNPIAGPDSLALNGLGYVNGVSLFGQSDGALYGAEYNATWQHQIFGDFRTGQIAVRGKNSGTWQAWRTILDSVNTPITAAGAALIDDANVAAQLATLGTAAYSEGTWTPVLHSFTVVGTAPAKSGVWKRIGNLMFITCTIFAGAGGNTSVAATAASSYIDGLPVAPTAAIVGIVANANIVNLGICFTDSGSRLFPSAFTAQTTAIIMSITYCA